MNPSQKTLRPKPPDKGSFPLDHEGECKQFMAHYMECLKRNGNDNSLCRAESRAYLQCRMERNLMTKEDFSKLGYKDKQDTPTNYLMVECHALHGNKSYRVGLISSSAETAVAMADQITC